jgi:hypothetical protein
MASTARLDEGVMTQTSGPRDHDVLLRLEFPECSREQLEEFAALVQEAVDEHAGGIALGAVVSGGFEPATIEIMFTVEARSQTEVHHRVALVVGAIEPVLPFSFGIEAATKRTPAREKPVPA